MPLHVFVKDDGDGKWALYKANTTGVNARYTKLIDEDVFSSIMTASQIKTAYESNPNTNPYTDAERLLLANQAGINTGDETTNSIKTKLGITGDGYVAYTGHKNNGYVDITGYTFYADGAEIGLDFANVYSAIFYNLNPNGKGVIVKGGGTTSSNLELRDYSNKLLFEMMGNGTATFYGNVSAPSLEITTAAQGIILKSQGGHRYQITVSDSGILSTVAI